MIKLLKNFLKGLRKQKFLNKFSFMKLGENTLMNKFSSKNSKFYMTKDDSLSLSSNETVIKTKINDEAKQVLKESIEKPDVLLDFIKSRGTVVIKSKCIKKILFMIKEKEGFIPPLKGFKAFVFTLALSKIVPGKVKIGFSTPALFALDDKPVNIYFLSYNFHMWLSYLNNLDGFDQQTRKKFNNIWDSDFESEKVSNLSIDDILSIQDMIAREKEAIDFVKEMARELVGQKNSLQKLREGKSVSL